MRIGKLAGLCGLLALCALPAVAQDQAPPPAASPDKAATAAPPKEVKRSFPLTKFELSGGFTHRSYHLAPGSSLGMNGAYASFDYNFWSKLGAEAEVLGVGKHAPNIPPPEVRVYAALIGPRIYPLGHHRITPFAHGLFGEGFLTSTTPTFAGLNGTTITHGGRVWEAGAGLDYSLSTHWGIRATGDYGAGNLSGNPGSGSTSTYTAGSGVRVAIGVVYRFGEK